MRAQQTLARHIYFLAAIYSLIIVLPAALVSQTDVQTDKSGTTSKDKSGILEITLKGEGMILPGEEQVYFRLYKSGLLEYQTLPDMTMHKGRISDQDAREIIQIAEQSDFLNSLEEYSALKKLRDATLTTTIIYTNNGKSKRIVIRNYQHDHPQAESYYPLSLRKLLRRVVELRPTTDYERKYGLNTVGISK